MCIYIRIWVPQFSFLYQLQKNFGQLEFLHFLSVLENILLFISVMPGHARAEFNWIFLHNARVSFLIWRKANFDGDAVIFGMISQVDFGLFTCAGILITLFAFRLEIVVYITNMKYS